MHKRLFFLLSVVLLALLWLLYSGERFCLWILSLALLVYTLAWAHIAYTLAKAQISQVTEPAEITSGAYGALRICLENPGRIPLAYMQIWYDTDETLVSGGKGNGRNLAQAASSYVPCILPGEDQTYTRRLFFPYRGVFAPGIRSMELCDAFGLIHYRAPARFYTGARQVTVLPRSLDLAMDGLDEGRVAGAVSEGGDEADPYTVAEIRQYRMGDTLKRVHWKLSARTGEIQVKEQEKVFSPSALVLLDLSPHEASGEKRLAIEHCACRYAAAVCEGMLNSRLPLRLTAYGEERWELSGTTHQEIARFKHFLAGLVFDCAYPFTDVIQMELARQGETSHIVIVTSAPPAVTRLS